jgi:hypothetical protein
MIHLSIGLEMNAQPQHASTGLVNTAGFFRSMTVTGSRKWIGMKGRNTMAVTIYDVAKVSQVSPATVSRVLNNHSYVNEEKRERVLKAIELLQFTPNPVARNLAWSNRTQPLSAAV